MLYDRKDLLPDIVFRAIFSVLVAADVLGNSLVILVILKNRSMMTAANYLLLNLAVADIMVAVSSIPGYVFNKTFVHPTGIEGDVLCSLVTGLGFLWIGQMASSTSLVFIAVERYYAVMHPLVVQRKITVSKVKILVPVCWILALIINVPEYAMKTYDAANYECVMKWSEDWHGLVYSVVCFISYGVVPVLIMVVLYSRVVRSLWFKDETSANFARQALLRSRKKVTQIMLTVSIIYVVTCLPGAIYYMVWTFYPFTVVRTAQITIDCLYVLNSTINPFVYTLQSAQFKKALRRLVCCNRRGSPVMPSWYHGNNCLDARRRNENGS